MHPQIHLALTPSGGIPAAVFPEDGSPPVPGSAECKIFNLEGGRWISKGIAREILNHSHLPVSPTQYVLVGVSGNHLSVLVPCN